MKSRIATLSRRSARPIRQHRKQTSVGFLAVAAAATGAYLVVSFVTGQAVCSCACRIT